MRGAVGEVEALAAMLLLFFDSSNWSRCDQLMVDRVGYVLEVLSMSASYANGMFDRFQIAYIDALPRPASDAEIVRRIRERCPDNRYEGSSDAELIELFKRNRQVLGRSDEDVIAAMTHPR